MFSPFFFNIFSAYFLHPSKISLKFYMFFYIANRQAWGHHIDLHDSHLLALEHQLLQSEYEDYAVANTSSIACLRSVALIVSKLRCCHCIQSEQYSYVYQCFYVLTS